MAVRTITKAEVEALTPRAREAFIWDQRLKGFGVRVTPKGAKSFVVDVYINGRRRRLTVGRYPPWTVEMARREASRWILDAQRGIDPSVKRHLRDRTVADLVEHYAENHLKQHARRAPQLRRLLERDILPRIGNRAATDVRRLEIVAIHSEIGERSRSGANQALILLRAVYNHARRNELLPAGADNPARDVRPYRLESRTRFLRADEMPRLFLAIQAAHDPYGRALALLLLATGCRVGEVLQAKWTGVDLDARTLTLRGTTTKSRRETVVALSRVAAAVIEALPRVGAWIFPDADGLGPMTYGVAQYRWATIRQAAELESVNMHDLRRSVASWLAQRGTSPLIIQGVLHHASTTVLDVYARLHLDPVRQALDLVAGEIEKAAGMSFMDALGRTVIDGGEVRR